MTEQERQWNEHVRKAHAAGCCEFSGYPFQRCARSICDCFMDEWTDEQIAEFAAAALQPGDADD